MFEEIKAPNLILFGTSSKYESAYSDESDRDENRILNEHWTHEFFKFVTDGKYNA